MLWMYSNFESFQSVFLPDIYQFEGSQFPEVFEPTIGILHPALLKIHHWIYLISPCMRFGAKVEAGEI